MTDSIVAIRQRICICCGPTDSMLTNEHVLGQWILRVLAPGLEGQIPHERRRWGRTERRWSRNKLDPTIKVVCKSCNEGWLSRLEGEAKSVVEPLILGKERRLDPQAQLAIATWAFKIATTLEFS